MVWRLACRSLILRAFPRGDEEGFCLIETESVDDGLFHGVVGVCVMVTDDFESGI